MEFLQIILVHSFRFSTETKFTFLYNRFPNVMIHHFLKYKSFNTCCYRKSGSKATLRPSSKRPILNIATAAALDRVSSISMLWQLRIVLKHNSSRLDRDLSAFNPITCRNTTCTHKYVSALTTRCVLRVT